MSDEMIQENFNYEIVDNTTGVKFIEPRATKSQLEHKDAMRKKSHRIAENSEDLRRYFTDPPVYNP